MQTDQPAFDLNAYLHRIGYAGERAARLDVLRALHEHHMAAIPFENLDVRLGRPVLLDLASLQTKLVGSRRGGYCFEQNSLFCAALRMMGFEVDTLEARVRPAEAENVLPRTHMVLRVAAGPERFLADVGFGGDGPLWPVPLSGEESVQPGGRFRVLPEGSWSVLETSQDGSWSDLYAFGPEPVLPIDYVVANHYTSTYPTSTFVRSLTVQRSTREARRILRGRTYTVRRQDSEEVRELPAAEIPALLRDELGLDVPDADVLTALGDR